MDKLLDAFRGESDLRRKAALDRQIQRKVDEAALVIPNYYVPYFRGAAWKWIRFPAWLSQKYFDDFYDPFGNTTGYAGYFWVDNDIRKQVIEAQRSGRTLAPRIFKDEANKAGGR
jgi:microcin C transport system substrate-binding protein